MCHRNNEAKIEWKNIIIVISVPFGNHFSLSRHEKFNVEEKRLSLLLTFTFYPIRFSHFRGMHKYSNELKGKRNFVTDSHITSRDEK